MGSFAGIEGCPHFFVLHADCDFQLALNECDELFAEAFAVPSGHEGMLLDGLVFMDEAREGEHFVLAGDQCGGDALAEADDLCGDPECFAEAFDVGGIFGGEEQGGAFGFWERDSAFDSFDQCVAVVFDEVARDVADGGECGGICGHSGGDVEEGVVFEDGSGGPIAFVGDLFSHGGDFSQDGELL